MENEAKRKRQPVRTPQEKLEDAFFDLSVPEQERMLGVFQTLHRMRRRLYDKPGQATQETLQGSLIDGAETARRAKP